LASPDLMSFLILYTIMFVGFVLMGWLIFGADTIYFNNFANSWESCWNFVLGNPPPTEVLVQSNRVVGPIYFAVFSVYVYFVLVNMFVAILNDAYNNVQRRGAYTPVRRKVVRKARRIFNRVKNTIKGKKMLSAKRLIEQMKDVRILDKEEVTLAEMKNALGGGATDEQAKELLDIHAKLHDGDVDPAIFGDLQLTNFSTRGTLRGKSLKSRKSTISVLTTEEEPDYPSSVKDELAVLHKKIDALTKLLTSEEDLVVK